MDPVYQNPEKHNPLDILHALAAIVGQLPNDSQVMLAPELQRLQDCLVEIDRKQRDETGNDRLKYKAALLDRAFTPISATDAQFRITYWNKAMEDLLGWTAEEVLGRRSTDVFQTQVPNSNRDAAIKILLEKGFYDGEAYYQHKDGHTIIAQASSNVLKGEYGDFLGLVSSFKDITEKQRAQEAVRENEQQKAFLLQLSDALRPLSDSVAILEAASQTAMAYFKTNRSYYCEIDGDVVTIRRDSCSQPDFPSVAGLYSLSEMPIFKNISQTGRPIVVPDVRTTDTVDEDLRQLCIQMKIIAYINVPVIKDGQLVGSFCLTQSTPRAWTTSEAALAAETAERTWAAVERARVEYELRRNEAILLESEASLSRSSQKISEILSSITDDFYVLDRDWKFIYANKQFTGRIGKEPEDLIGNVIWEMFPKHVGSILYENFHASMERGETRRFEVRGQYTDACYSMTCFPSAEGITVLGQDVTERVRAEEALRQSERVHQEANERFRTSIESLAEAFVMYSAVRSSGKIVDLRYEYVNNQACAFHHLSREQLVGHTILEVIPAVVETGLFDQYVQVVETGEPLSGQRYVSNHSEDAAQPAAAGQPQSRAQGVFDFRVSKFGDGMIITANDVTERVRLEAEQQEAIKEREIHHRLTEQREMERQSIARDIHDGPVQTLSSLLFNLQMLRDAYADPALQLEVDNVKLSIKSTVQELRQIMYELRPPSVIQFGISKAIQAYTENLREHHPSITWNLDLADDALLLSQQTCLTLFRIYQEAVNNIIRHSEARQTWVSLKVLPGQLILEIRDNGKGFVRGQDMARLTERKHFGLAGIGERVEAIHGEWEIKTRPGDGTSITVKVPIQSP